MRWRALPCCLVVAALISLASGGAMAEASTTEDLLRAYIEAWNGGDLETLDAIVSDDFARHGNYGSAASRQELEEMIAGFRTFYRDLRIEIQDILAGEDKAAMRWRFTGGFGDTGFEMDSVNFGMYHFVDGRISREWVVGNTIDYWTGMGYTVMPPGTRMIPPPVELPLGGEPAVAPPVDSSELLAYAEETQRSARGRSGRLELAAAIDCLLALDGRTIGWLGAGESVTLTIERGEHFLQAASRGGSIFVRQTLNLKKGQTTRVVLEAPSRMIVHPRNRTAEDLETGLMWQMTDNGDDITRDRAEAYCSTLSQGGFGNWRLPHLFELERLYDPESAPTRRFRTLPGITLTGCCPWTSTPHGDFHWTFVFYNGLRYIKYRSIGRFSRALCVRNTWNSPTRAD